MIVNLYRNQSRDWIFKYLVVSFNTLCILNLFLWLNLTSIHHKGFTHYVFSLAKYEGAGMGVEPIISQVMSLEWLFRFTLLLVAGARFELTTLRLWASRASWLLQPALFMLNNYLLLIELSLNNNSILSHL